MLICFLFKNLTEGNWFLNFYLFIYFDCAGSSLLRGLFSSCREQGLLSSCGTWASHWGGFSRCGARESGLQYLWRDGSVVAAPGLQSTGLEAVVCEFSCCMACGIFLSQGLNPCLVHWHAGSVPLSHQGSPKSLFVCFFKSWIDV